jgi:hypothetical protein
MTGYFMYSKNATKEEISNYETDKHISKEKWIQVINNDNDCFWKDNTLMGQRRINDAEHPLASEWYNTQVFCFPDKEGYSDFLISFLSYRINFQFPRVTEQRLHKMKKLAEDLDCYFVYGGRIIDDKMFQKLLDKYDKSKKG